MTLDLTLLTWFLFLVTTLLWAASSMLAGGRALRRTLTWRVIPLSLFGFAWLAFGALFIMRFVILLYDPVYFGATNYSLTKISAADLSKSWLYLGICWVAFCTGVGLMLLWGLQAPTVILRLEDLASPRNVELMDIIAVVTTVLTVLTKELWLPRSLLTLGGHLSSLYILPLMLSWLLYFQGQDIGRRRYYYIIPGLVSYLLDPYRQTLLFLTAGICLPAMRMKKGISLVKFLVGVLTFLTVITVITYSYRDYLSGEETRYEATSFAEQWETWELQPYKSPWVRLATRFHGFDSLALTIFAVPQYIPYSHKNIFSELMVRGFIPRAIFPTKPERAQAREFSTSIWALGRRGFVERRVSSSMIAPSLPGDLFSVNGVTAIIFGSLIYGLLVGLLENWARTSGLTASCILVGFFGVGVAGGLERDFVLAASSLIHNLIIFLVAVFILQYLTVTKASNREKIKQRKKSYPIFTR
jgi:hypothetical protein